MSKPYIQNYAALMAEKERLQNLLKAQKQGIANEIKSIKIELHPATLALKGIGLFTRQNKTLGLINGPLNKGVDFLLKKVILKKSGWITRLVVPFLVKNLVSNLAAKKIEKEIPSVRQILNPQGKKVK